jgi:hypothetical protein
MNAQHSQAPACCTFGIDSSSIDSSTTVDITDRRHIGLWAVRFLSDAPQFKSLSVRLEPPSQGRAAMNSSTPGALQQVVTGLRGTTWTSIPAAGMAATRPLNHPNGSHARCGGQGQNVTRLPGRRLPQQRPRSVLSRSALRCTPDCEGWRKTRIFETSGTSG